jgi:hypothetical protein
MNRLSVLGTMLSLLLVAAVGCGGPSGRSAAVAARGAQPRLEKTATAVRLQATIYEMRVPPERIAALDAAKLAKADFAKAPPDLGQPRALYRIDQRVNLSGDSIVVGTQEPMVTSTRVTDSGKKVSSVSYNSVGAIVDFKAERRGPRRLQVTSTIELSSRTESPVTISDGVTSPVIRKANMSMKGPVNLGEASVLVSADASSLDKDGKAVVYVVRLVVGANGS